MTYKFGQNYILNVKDFPFNAVGDGATDDRAAIAAADSAANATGYSISFPAGTYKIHSNLTIASPVKFELGSKLSIDTGVTVHLSNTFQATNKQFIFSGLGQVTFAQNSLPGPFVPEWWGAVGTATISGGTDDILPIRAMIASAIATQALVFSVALPHFHFAGNYAISDTITFTGLLQDGLFTGDRNSGFIWIGSFDDTYTTPLPAINLKSCQYSVWQNLSIAPATGHQLAEGWRLITQAGLGVSLAHRFEHCVVAFAEIGWRVGGGLDNNNDSHAWYSCLSYQNNYAGWTFEDSQIFGVTLFDCGANGTQSILSGDYDNVGITSGQKIIDIASPTILNFSPAGFFSNKDVGKVVQILDDGYVVSRTTFASFDPSHPTQITITDAVTHNVTSGHLSPGPEHSGIDWGTQCAIATRAIHPLPGQSNTGGGFVVNTFETGGMLNADFLTGGHIGQCCIKDIGSEASSRFLVQPGLPGGPSSNFAHMTVEDCRIDAELALAAYPFVDWEGNAILRFSNVNFGDPASDGYLVLKIGNDTVAADEMVMMDNCVISTNQTPLQCFPRSFPDTSINTTFIQYAVDTFRLGDRAPFLGDSIASQTVSFGSRHTQVLTINVDTQITLTNLMEGFGETMTLILITNPGVGPFKVTWAQTNIIWVGGEPPPFITGDFPTGYSPTIIEFRTARDGASYPWITQIILARVVSHPFGTIAKTLSNGLNSDIDFYNAHGAYTLTPTADYSIGGIIAPACDATAAPNTILGDNFEITFHNFVNHSLTIVNQDASSTARNRIYTLTGKNLVLPPGYSSVTLRYETASLAWIVRDTHPAPLPVVTTITASTYTIDTGTANASDSTIFTDSTSNIITLTLPSPTIGRTLVIKDKTGKAGTNPVTISQHASETIDGATTLVLNTNYASATLQSDGTNWSII